MLACALLLAASSWSFDEAALRLREGDALIAARILDEHIQRDPEDREAVLLLAALYDELADKTNAERIAKLRAGFEPDAKLTALARAGVQVARQKRRPLRRSTSPAQWAQLVKLAETQGSSDRYYPDLELAPRQPPLIAPGFELNVPCQDELGCNDETQDECCVLTSAGLKKPRCVPIGTCARPRVARGACFTSFKPAYCELVRKPGVTLQAARCDAARGDITAVARVLDSAALANLVRIYGQMWPKTLPLAQPSAKVVARVDADGDGAEDVLVEIEIVGSRKDPQAGEYSLNLDPQTCSRVFVVSGERVTLAGNEGCGSSSSQRFRGLAISKAAPTPILWMETEENHSVGTEALTWDGVEYTRVFFNCTGQG